MTNDELLTRFQPKVSGTVLEYQRQLWHAKFSPCGTFLIAPAYDASVQRWKISDQQFVPLAPLNGHHGWVQCLAFTPDSQRILTADSWGQLSCWQLADEVVAPIWSQTSAHDGWIRGLAVSADGTCVATAGNDRRVRLWSAVDGQPQAEFQHSEKVFSVAFHPQEKALLSGDLLGVIRHWDISTGQVTRQIDASALYQLHNIQQCGGARHLSLHPDGSQLVCAGQKSPQGGFAQGLPCVLVFDWSTSSLIREMQVGTLDDGFVYDACFHPQGFVMAASCAFPGKGHVWFWSPQEESAFYLSNEIPNGRSLSLHPDGRRLAQTVSLSANGNGRVLQDGQYVGGSSKIYILDLPA